MGALHPTELHGQAFLNLHQTLAPLPVLRYQFKKQFQARVIKNGHVNLGPDKYYYSVPYRYIGKRVSCYTRAPL